MSEEVQTPAPSTAVEKNAAAPPGDELTGLLNSYEQQTAPTQEPTSKPAEPAAEPSKVDAPKPQLFDGMQPRFKLPDANSPESLLRADVDALSKYVMAHRQERVTQQRASMDQAALTGIMSEFAPEIAELKNLPADIIPLRLKIEEELNPELRNALARRYESEEAWKFAQAAARKSVEKVVRDAAKENQRRDPENAMLTEDRMLVSQAVRGASRMPPPPPRVKLSELSDKDLAAWQKSNLGYVSKTLV